MILTVSSTTTSEGPHTQVFRRVLGVYDKQVPGATFVALGGIHGNEPAGVHALLRVLASLEERQLPLRGRFVALGGNLAALRTGQRFIDRDLNRAWTLDNLEALRAQDSSEDDTEDREQRELVEILDQVRREARGPVIFVDLHTSSAPGASFACMSDTLANRRIAMALPVPIILGLEECIDGAIMDYFNRHKMVAVAVEGGREDDPGTIDNLEAAVWIGLLAAAMLSSDCVDRGAYERCLRESAGGLPRVLEVRHRQHIEPGEEFLMEPGFKSFDEVRKGRLLASGNGQSFVAHENCRVLLPLYQGLGDDGYFLVRSVGVFWLWFAGMLRRCRMHAFVHWLPGVRRHPEQNNTLIVAPFAKRLFAREIFHLLGFRRLRTVQGEMCFSRRPDPVIDGAAPVD